MPRQIAILGGTGAEGSGLALRLAAAGCAVRIGSRDALKADQAARRCREQLPSSADVAGFGNAEAVKGAEITILTVPLGAQISTLKAVRSAWRAGAVVVDATVPLEIAIGGRLSQPLTLPAGSAAQQAARYVPESVSVVAAFHCLSAELLGRLGEPVDCDVLMCGDDSDAKARVSSLVELIPGARTIDAGPLENARMVETLAALLIGLNLRYKGKHSGIRITGLEKPE